jgi:hypothetical protein
MEPPGGGLGITVDIPGIDANLTAGLYRLRVEGIDTFERWKLLTPYRSVCFDFVCLTCMLVLS